MTGPLLLGVDVAASFRFLEALGSERGAPSTGEVGGSSIISSDWIWEGSVRCDGGSQGTRLAICMRFERKAVKCVVC